MELGLGHQGENWTPDSSFHFVKNVLVEGLDQYCESTVLHHVASEVVQGGGHERDHGTSDFFVPWPLC